MFTVNVWFFKRLYLGPDSLKFITLKTVVLVNFLSPLRCRILKITIESLETLQG